MKNLKFLTGAIAISLISIAGANAHPGSKLLIVGENERAAMGKGVTYENKHNVHLFKGAKKLAGGDAAAAVRHRGLNLEIEIKTPFRRIRRLCTQGFYSGDCGRSRQYTKRFYSGR